MAVPDGGVGLIIQATHAWTAVDTDGFFLSALQRWLFSGWCF